MANEIVDFAEKRYGLVGMDFKDLWRNKSRLIAGKDIPDGI